jgi:hypothetical protein
MDFDRAMAELDDGKEPLTPRQRKRKESVRKMLVHEQAMQDKSDALFVPKPAFRQRVRELAERQWGRPTVAIHLADVKPAYNVPGRRKDGTVIGRRTIRRFF